MSCILWFVVHCIFLSAFVGWYIEGRISMYSRKPCWPIFYILPWIRKIILKILPRLAISQLRFKVMYLSTQTHMASPVTEPDVLEKWHIPVTGKTVLNVMNIPASKNHLLLLPNTSVLCLFIHTAFREFPILAVPKSNLTIVLYSFISV